MKTNSWQIQEAKNNFSEVVSLACSAGAQTITKHGKPVAVVVAIGEFQSLKRSPAKKKRARCWTFCAAVRHLKSSPTSRKAGSLQTTDERSHSTINGLDAGCDTCSIRTS